MPPREWRLRIEDILDAAARAQRYVADMELAAFVADDRTLDAVSRCFGIIGEAVSAVPREIIAAHPEIPWAEMRAMRNIVVHEYFGVTNETLWKTAREDLPAIVEPLHPLDRHAHARHQDHDLWHALRKRGSRRAKAPRARGQGEHQAA